MKNRLPPGYRDDNDDKGGFDNVLLLPERLANLSKALADYAASIPDLYTKQSMAEEKAAQTHYRDMARIAQMFAYAARRGNAEVGEDTVYVRGSFGITPNLRKAIRENMDVALATLVREDSYLDTEKSDLATQIFQLGEAMREEIAQTSSKKR